MAHFPVNHHLRPLYRALAGIAGIYMLVFGIVGLSQTSGLPLFTQDEARWALGLRTNPAFAILSIVAGAVVILANLIGRKVGHQINQLAAIVFVVVGLASMLLLQTDANFFAFSMTNVIVTFILALVVGTASLYDRAGTAEEADAEEAFRHG